MIRTTSQRAFAASCAMAAVFTTFSIRLVYVQIMQHEHWSQKAAQQNSHPVPVFARRGSILDVRGETLAQNEPVRTVVADASLIKDQAAFAARLAEPLRIPVEVIRKKLARTVPSKRGDGKREPNCYIVLKKDVPEEKAAEIAHLVEAAKKEGLVLSLDAICFKQDFVRSYPNGSLLCHVLGYLNDQGAGVDGIEASMNAKLEGQDGVREISHDRTGRELVPYAGSERLARNGGTVRLTIDMTLQQIVEHELDTAVAKYSPKKATIIMMNPKTGDIMAMANRPNFNPNPVRPGDKPAGKSERSKETKKVEASMEDRLNIAIAAQVEPGSTFKIVTTAAALSEHLVHPDTEVFCENGYWQWCKLHDHHPYGELTVKNILVKSSNIGVAKLGIQLGEQRFFEYVQKFGFGQHTSVNLPGEIRGVVKPPYEWEKISITRMPMGQSVAATPLQIANAMCAVANGGTLMVPQILREVERDGEKTEYPPQEIRRVVSKKATEQVRDALIEVVGPKGTAAKAAVPGFKVAGKTGTAQKADAQGKMNHEAYVVSFVGYMPAQDPAFVMLVLLDEAQTKHSENYGGIVAAPIFSSIAQKAAVYLGLKPTEPIPVPPGTKGAKPTPAPAILASDADAARDQ